MYHVLYNPMSSGNSGTDKVRALESRLTDDKIVYRDITKIADLFEEIQSLPPEDKVVIAGGDGTLNQLVNQVGHREVSHQLFYYPVGSGNDFALDIGEKPEDKVIPLNDYIRDLPTVDVDGRQRCFVNGVGYGLDGYCCAEGARLRKLSNKPVNYTAIALRALAYAFHPGDAKVTVDGVTRSYRKVWLAPTMYGRYFGGGMMIAPTQDRNNPERKLTVIVVHDCSRLKTLWLFPKIFKGKHIKSKDVVEVLTGNEVTVEFDRSMDMQIDGETVPGATSCHCVSGPGRS